MGVPPMSPHERRSIGSEASPALKSHGQDARGTHGRDGRATITPHGVTTNETSRAAATARFSGALPPNPRYLPLWANSMTAGNYRLAGLMPTTDSRPPPIKSFPFALSSIHPYNTTMELQTTLPRETGKRFWSTTTGWQYERCWLKRG